MSEIKLLPCPFCSGRPEVIEVTEDDGFENRGGSAIECQGCHASSHVEFGRKENLVSSWNARAPFSSAAVAEREPVGTVAEVRADGKRLYNTTYPSDALDKLSVGTAIYIDSPPTSELEALRKRVAEIDAHRRKVTAENERLLNALIERDRRVAELEAENARLRAERDDLKEEWQAEFESRVEANTALRMTKSRLAEVEKALEPFAAVAEHDIGDDETDDDIFWPISNARYSMSGRLRVGHLRAARRVREGGKVE